jgi:hypothetical protein
MRGGRGSPSRVVKRRFVNLLALVSLLPCVAAVLWG